MKTSRVAEAKVLLMAYFRVILHGDSLCIQHDLQSESVLGIPRNPEKSECVIGFYATRFVCSVDEKGALHAAIALVLHEWSRPPLDRINSGQGPRLTAETVEKIGLMTYLRARRRRGFTFYTNKSDVISENNLLN